MHQAFKRTARARSHGGYDAHTEKGGELVARLLVGATARDDHEVWSGQSRGQNGATAGV